MDVRIKLLQVLGLAVATLVVTAPTIVHASVLWTGDFETGNLSQWSFKFLEKQLKVVSSPVRDGKLALELTALNNGDRVEVQNGSASATNGTERYYAWSVMAPKPLGPNDHQTGYFESKNSYKQIMAFVIKGADVSLDTRFPNSQRRWTGKGKFTPGVWHDFVFHVKWSQDAAVGLIELWFDGQKAFEPIHLPTLADQNDAFFQVGFLSGQAGEVLYVDEARVATALLDVMLAPPPMPDAGMPQVGGAGGAAASGGSAGSGGTGGTRSTGGAGGVASGGAAGASSQSMGGTGGGETIAPNDGAGGEGGVPDETTANSKARGCALSPRNTRSTIPFFALPAVLILRRRRKS